MIRRLLWGFVEKQIWTRNGTPKIGSTSLDIVKKMLNSIGGDHWLSTSDFQLPFNPGTEMLSELRLTQKLLLRSFCNVQAL